MKHTKTVCFFSKTGINNIKNEQYSIQDVRILNELGYEVVISDRFSNIPNKPCEFYFSWWASGSILPLIKAKLLFRPIFVVAGGQEAMFHRDSLSDNKIGYLATPWYKKMATRLTLRFANRVIVVSKAMVDHAKRLGARNPVVIYNSVDTRLFCPSDVKREYITSVFNSDFNVIENKRAEIFIRSIPLVLSVFPEEKFIIIGRLGAAIEYLNSIVENLRIKDSIQFISEIDNVQIIGYYQRSKMYVQISDSETFGVAIAEAMSCEVPVVVSRGGAIPEVVGDSGVYVDHNDVNSVAKGIIGLLQTDKAELTATGRKSRNRIQDLFSYEIRKERIKDTIDELLNKNF